MKELEASVRAIEKDGLVWGGGKLVPIGFGIKKLQINIVIEDDKVSLDELQEEIQEIEEYVQSTDIVSADRTFCHGSTLISITRPLCKSCRLSYPSQRVGLEAVQDHLWRKNTIFCVAST